MISKELLESITEMKIGYIREEDKGKTIAYSSRFPNCEFWNNHRINIYELANKCKEWIVSKGLSYAIYYDDSFKNYKCTVLQENCNDGFDSIGDTFVSSTEIEAVFSACRYILNNKNIK